MPRIVRLDHGQDGESPLATNKLIVVARPLSMYSPARTLLTIIMRFGVLQQLPLAILTREFGAAPRKQCPAGL
jgi:hypothetical protein